MTDIPSDFDPSILFSDYPDPDDARLPPPLAHNSSSFSDDLEAIYQVQEEQREKFDKEGVVIRHRPKDLGLLCRGREFESLRSSSHPPETPTPNPRPFPRRPFSSRYKPQLDNQFLTSSFSSLPPSPCTARPQLQTSLDSDRDEVHIMTADYPPDSSILEYPSSPPAQMMTPPLKFRTLPIRQSPKDRNGNGFGEKGPFTYIDSDDEAEGKNCDGDAQMAGVSIFGKATETISTVTRAEPQITITTPPRKPAVPRRPGPFEEIDDDDDRDVPYNDVGPSKRQLEVNPFTTADPLPRHNLSHPLPGNRGRNAFPPKPRALPFSYGDDDDAEIGVDDTPSEADIVLPNSVINRYATLSTSPNDLATSYVPIRLDSGKILQIRRREKRHFTAQRNPTEHTYDKDGNKEMKTSYYGVPIHKLLDDLNAEKALAQYSKEKEEQEKAKRMEMEIETLIAEGEAIVRKGKGKATATSIPGRGPEPPQSKSPTQCLLWTEKYRAKRFMDLLGDERTHRQVLRWLKSWEDIVFPGSARSRKLNNHYGNDNKDGAEFYQHRKVLLITGPPGLGKTTLAHVAARQCGYEPLEINASDDRTQDVVTGKIRDALSNEGMKIPGATTLGGPGNQRKNKGIGSGKPVCVIIDEVDGVTGGGGESSFMKALIDLIHQDQKNSANSGQAKTNPARRKKKNGKDNFKFHRPIIAICNDLYAPSLRALRPLAEIVYMRKPPANLVVSRMRWVFDREGIPAEDNAIRRLVELATSGNASAAGGGDMRGCLVGGEWLAKKLQAMSVGNDTTGTTCAKLTRKIVEEELDGKEGGKTRGGVRGCVERIFKKDNKTTSKSKSGLSSNEARAREWENLKQEVECCGEYDKVMSDCFATYLDRPYHDDTLLTKPCTAYDWLFFHDAMSSRVFSEQEFELMAYLSVPALAFNHLFGSSTASARHHNFTTSDDPSSDNPEKEPLPFTGPKADYDHREGVKLTKDIAKSFRSSFFTSGGKGTGTGWDGKGLQLTPDATRFATTFKNTEMIVTELAPYLTRILSPRVNPILVGGSGGAPAIASVRRENEKKLVMRAVEVMATVSVGFEKVRVEGFGPTGGVGGWSYRMEPAFDALATFPTFNTSSPAANSAAETTTSTISHPTRYATRQVLMQEYHKYILLQKALAREARLQKHGLTAGTTTSHPSLAKKTLPTGPTPVTAQDLAQSGKISTLKRDFFGRPIQAQPHPTTTGTAEADNDSAAAATSKRTKLAGSVEQKYDRDMSLGGGGKGGNSKVWVTFHEGFSNAVRKGITIEDLMGGFY